MRKSGEVELIYRLTNFRHPLSESLIYEASFRIFEVKSPIPYPQDGMDGNFNNIVEEGVVSAFGIELMGNFTPLPLKLRLIDPQIDPST